MATPSTSSRSKPSKEQTDRYNQNKKEKQLLGLGKYESFPLWSPPPRNSLEDHRYVKLGTDTLPPAYTSLFIDQIGRWLCPNPGCTILKTNKNFAMAYCFGYTILDTQSARGLVRMKGPGLYKTIGEEDIAIFTNPMMATKCCRKSWDEHGKEQECDINRLNYPPDIKDHIPKGWYINLPEGREGYINPTASKLALDRTKYMMHPEKIKRHFVDPAYKQDKSIWKGTWICPKFGIPKEESENPRFDAIKKLAAARNKGLSTSGRFMRVSWEEQGGAIREKLIFVNAFPNARTHTTSHSADHNDGHSQGSTAFDCGCISFGDTVIEPDDNTSCGYTYGEMPKLEAEDEQVDEEQAVAAQAGGAQASSSDQSQSIRHKMSLNTIMH